VSDQKVYEHELFPIHPRSGARKYDPETSKSAAKSVFFRSGSQKCVLLMTYHKHGELTDEEAGEMSGLRSNRSCCYWKRCSELREAGYITVVGLRRSDTTKEAQQTCHITETGFNKLKELGLV
jgi:hypothetical protein